MCDVPCEDYIEIVIHNEEDLGVIYLITNNINGKQYVGQAVRISSGRPWGSNRRWQKHYTNAEKGKCECILLENAIRKYGKDNFTVRNIGHCHISELNDAEIKCIELYNTMAPNGYNLMSGGGNGRKHSEESKKKMSISRTGKKHTEQTKLLIGIAHTGKLVQTSTRELIGKTSKYRGMSDENKARIKEALDILNLEHLPMYISYSLDKRNDRNVDIISVRIPKQKQKKFGRKDMSLSEKIRLAIEHKNLILNGCRSEELP